MKTPDDAVLLRALGMAHKVAACVDDAEAAHGAEDALRAYVLRRIIAGYPNPKALARIGMSTARLDFGRWCG